MNPYILIGQPTNCILVQVIGYISLVNLLCHEKICTGVLCPKGCLHHNIFWTGSHRNVARLISNVRMHIISYLSLTGETNAGEILTAWISRRHSPQ
jgi:hypothetical protein